MPIRNPFKKLITAEQLHEQNLRDNAANGFKTVDVSGKGIEIKEPTEYQLSGKWTLHRWRDRDECRCLQELR